MLLILISPEPLINSLFGASGCSNLAPGTRPVQLLEVQGYCRQKDEGGPVPSAWVFGKLSALLLSAPGLVIFHKDGRCLCFQLLA